MSRLRTRAVLVVTGMTCLVGAIVPPVLAQEEKGAGIGYEKAGEILQSSMPVHRTILPKIVYQIENLTNLDQIPSKAKVVALPAKWKTESAPARVIALLDD